MYVQKQGRYLSMVNKSFWKAKSRLAFHSHALTVWVRCFFQVQNLVRLIVPLREVTLAQKRRHHRRKGGADLGSSGTSTMLVDTKDKNRFIFTRINDLDFVLRKISDLLWVSGQAKWVHFPSHVCSLDFWGFGIEDSFRRFSSQSIDRTPEWNKIGQVVERSLCQCIDLTFKNIPYCRHL